MKKPTFAQGIVFNPPFETDYEVTINYIIMKDEIIIDGIHYKRVDKELTLEDCIKDNRTAENWNGAISSEYGSRPNGYGLYPTEAIAEKVLLYGLLQSVAYKLNEGKNGDWFIFCHDNMLITDEWIRRKENYHVTPVFASKDLALQAIRIFENSKFDLKKLFQ
jgi:hypothetical protein